MATLSICNAKRRNVSPKSSTLNVVTRDIDCSGMGHSPEDGEFVPQDGDPFVGGTYFGAAAANVDASSNNATSLAMVWGSARRSDRQALGDTRVTVLAMGGIEVECQLLNCLNDTSTLDSNTNLYKVGQLVSVAIQKQALSSVTGDVSGNKRLLLTPMAEDDCGWAVGYVVSSSTKGSGPANGDSVTVYLYDKPRHVGSDA